MATEITAETAKLAPRAFVALVKRARAAMSGLEPLADRQAALDALGRAIDQAPCGQNGSVRIAEDILESDEVALALGDAPRLRCLFIQGRLVATYDSELDHTEIVSEELSESVWRKTRDANRERSMHYARAREALITDLIDQGVTDCRDLRGWRFNDDPLGGTFYSWMFECSVAALSALKAANQLRPPADFDSATDDDHSDPQEDLFGPRGNASKQRFATI